MDAIEFINRYPDYISLLEKVVKSEYKPVIKKLKKLDPHNIIKPEHYLNSEAEAMGVVFLLFLKKLNTSTPEKLTKEETQLRLSHEIDAAKKLLAANGIQSCGLWCVDDIIDKAKEMKKRCGKKDARIILAHIEQDFDAEYGITWRTIEQYVEDYFRNKK